MNYDINNEDILHKPISFFDESNNQPISFFDEIRRKSEQDVIGLKLESINEDWLKEKFNEFFDERIKLYLKNIDK